MPRLLLPLAVVAVLATGPVTAFVPAAGDEPRPSAHAATIAGVATTPNPQTTSSKAPNLGPDSPPGGSAGTFDGYRLPLSGTTEILAGFDPPATKYSAGHRGVDLSAAQGSPVLAAGQGVVRFTGIVAGRGVLVIEHPDGVSTEYEPVRAQVRAGQLVRIGQVVAVLAGRHERCDASSCLHWGARRGENYIDPMTLLDQLGVVRLID